MRPLSHLTPLYVSRRLRQLAWQSRNPSVPWLAIPTVKLLDSYLKSSDKVLEFGSGRSTQYLAQRVEKIISIEHNEEWYNKLNDLFENHIERERVNLIHVDKSSIQEWINNTAAWKSFIHLIDAPFDLILIDGIFRLELVIMSIPLLNDSGMLILDDAHRFFAPIELGTNKLLIKAGLSESRTRAAETIIDYCSNFRKIWLTDGIYHDLLLIKSLKS